MTMLITVLYYILKELEVIIAGINNNTPIEEVLLDFGMCTWKRCRDNYYI